MLGTASVAAGATPEYDLARIDAADYPTLGLIVRSPSATAPPAVYENGAKVTGVDVQSLGKSKAIVLAIDRSKSMHGQPLVQAGAAARQFLAQKRHADRVAIVTFGHTALTQAKLQQATIDSTSALRTLATDRIAGTALADAVVVSSAELASQPLASRVLILLTDGRDVQSIATWDEAVRSARRAKAVVYAIALGDADRAPLKRLARATGGRVYASPRAGQLADVYRKIGAELTHTWRMAYTTAARPGEKVTVNLVSKNGPAGTFTVPGESYNPSGSWLPAWAIEGSRGVLLLLALVGTLIFLAVRQAQALPQAARIKRLVRSHTDPRGSQAARRKRQRPTLAIVLSSLDQRLRGFRRFERVERLVESAAAPVSASTVIVGALGIAVLLPLLAALSGISSAAVIILLFGVGLLAPFVILRMIATRRIHAFEAQLPDVLSTIAGSLRVGHGLKASLQGIADEGAPPISTELRIVLSQARLGRALEEALVAMCERLGSEDLLYVATAVDVNSQVGGSLAGVFSTVADTVRVRQQHRSKVRALTATGRASAGVLTAFPIALVAIMLLINPDYMVPFLESGIGQVLTVYSIISMTIGAFVLTRIVNIKA